jgi:hypothetical protein
MAKLGADVTVTDLAPNLALLQHNCAANGMPHHEGGSKSVEFICVTQCCLLGPEGRHADGQAHTPAGAGVLYMHTAGVTGDSSGFMHCQAPCYLPSSHG